MCGINGFLKYKKINDSDIEKIKTMNSEMLYRGPNENDIFADDRVVLGQVRLSIIGVSNGHQPIFNENKNLVLICNGEIYNYQEIREDLIKKGHKFSTDSDCEVIIHLFEEKKEKCLDDLRGMFAFAIYDLENKSLFIARDINGKKPLYYAQTSSGFVFSSEITEIQEHFINKPKLDWGEINNYLKYWFSQSTYKTHIKLIKKLQPGEYGYVKGKKIKLKKYWQKKNTYSYNKSYDEAKKECLEILKEAVRIRLRSDVPIAILLSGGIDSAAVVSIASELQDNIHAITVGYRGCPDYDERKIAKRLAQEKNIIWHELELDENDYLQYFEEHIKYLDEPVVDKAAIAQWGIYKKAKELGFTVLLSGNGGDELFYGYLAHTQRAEEFKSKKDKFYLRKIKFDRYVILISIVYFLKNIKLLNRSHKQIDYFYEKKKVSVEDIYDYLFNIWLPHNCYYLSDKLGMGNSLEIRAPFSDKKLIEFVSSLPLDYKFHKDNPKGFLKDVLTGIVPDYILNAPKQGFVAHHESIQSIVDNYYPQVLNVKRKNYENVFIDKFLSTKINTGSK